MSGGEGARPAQFKGWTIPGPRVPGPGLIESGELGVEEGESLDALSGHYKLFQLKKGHRFSTDDVIVAAFATQHGLRAERVLDLGSGLGTVAMITAWRLPFAKFTTVEAQEQSYALAQKSRRYNGLDDRFDQRFGDFREPGVFKDGETFELITGSPPYFPLDAGVLGDHPQKIACRFEVRGTVWDYAAAAAPRLAPGGMFAVVFPVNPVDQAERVERAARENGLVILRRRDVCFREGEPPLLGLFLMMRAQDLPEALHAKLPIIEPVLTIRRADGTVDPEYSAFKLSVGFPP